MDLKKGSMLYFAEVDYKNLKVLLKNIEGLEDAVLVRCEQCVEKYMKVLLKEKLGEINTSHNLSVILNKLLRLYPELDKYKALCRFLKDCYYDRNYETEGYYELEDKEFKETLEESLQLIDYLRNECLK
ncbi:MAG: putative hepn domain [Clostridia bacterium]|jgi:HEPN domain-containing protein|nr:putative hepn domain [Clostridia bacterium]